MVIDADTMEQLMDKLSQSMDTTNTTITPELQRAIYTDLRANAVVNFNQLVTSAKLNKKIGNEARANQLFEAAELELKYIKAIDEELT